MKTIWADIDDINIDRLVSPRTDYMGKAAEAINAADEAAKAGRMDAAWALYGKAREHYRVHAKRFDFTTQQIIALDASVFEKTASILRKEGQHDEALAHILYLYLNDSRPSQSRAKKVATYLKRSSFKHITPNFIESMKSFQPIWQLDQIKTHIKRWREEQNTEKGTP